MTSASDLITKRACSTPKPSCTNCALSPSCLPPSLDAAELNHLENLIEKMRPLTRGEALFRQNDPFTAIYAVRSGCIKTLLTLADGTEQITGFYLPGDIVGLSGIAKHHYSTSAIAVESTTLCAFPFDALSVLTQRYSTLQQHVYQLLSQEITEDQRLLLQLGQCSAEIRLSTFLLSISARQKRRRLAENHFLMPMSRTDIANHLGLAIETVSRLFTRMQDNGVLDVNGKDIRIINREYLCHNIENESIKRKA
jgi:CRP/FNR family transcriptional regulator